MLGFASFFRKSKIAPAIETRASDLASPESWLFDLFGATPNQSGVSVTPTNAMRSTPVRAAVEAICETVGGLPCEIHERDASGALRPATDHPAYRLLHDFANDWTPAPLFIEQITRDALLQGNGFAFVGRANGEPVELIRLRPDTVSVTLDTITSEPVYRLSDAYQKLIAARVLNPNEARALENRAPYAGGDKFENPNTTAAKASANNAIGGGNG